MSAVPLKIFLHGLIALVPIPDPGGANRLTALLVDGRMTMGEQCMTEHHPKLTFFVSRNADCVSVSGCTLSGDRCTCRYSTAKGVDPVAGKQIWLDIQPAPALAPPISKSPPPNPLPSNSGEAASFSYVANLSQSPLNLAVDPIYLAPVPSPAARTHMVARMEVPYESVTSCALATREDDGQTNVHELSFRELHAPSQSGEVSYAMAQKVVAQLTVPDGGTVNLHISDFGGANDHSFRLKPGLDAYRVDVGNDPEAPLDRDDPCDDGVARHFLHYYEMALTVPAKALLPHVRPTQSSNWTSLEPAACKDPVFGPAARPICPVATFNP